MSEKKNMIGAGLAILKDEAAETASIIHGTPTIDTASASVRDRMAKMEKVAADRKLAEQSLNTTSRLIPDGEARSRRYVAMIKPSLFLAIKEKAAIENKSINAIIEECILKGLANDDK